MVFKCVYAKRYTIFPLQMYPLLKSKLISSLQLIPVNIIMAIVIKVIYVLRQSL